VIISLSVFAAESELPSWAQWGVLGLVVAGFVARQLVPGWLYSDVKAENQVLRQENKELVQLVLETQKSTIPALEEASKAVNEAMTELRYLRRQVGESGGG
jgi:hypothetical protein